MGMSQNDKNQLSGDECIIQFFGGTNLLRNENGGFERLERLERKGNKECVCITSVYPSILISPLYIQFSTIQAVTKQLQIGRAHV